MGMQAEGYNLNKVPSRTALHRQGTQAEGYNLNKVPSGTAPLVSSQAANVYAGQVPGMSADRRPRSPRDAPSRPLSGSLQRGNAPAPLKGCGFGAVVTSRYGSEAPALTAPCYTAHTSARVIITAPRRDATDVDSAIHPDVYAVGKMLERADPAPESRQQLWRTKLGKFAVKDILIPALAANGHPWPRDKITQARLRAFPTGYTLVSVPRLVDDDHNDAYLCTSDGRRWRSPEEFGPHLAWLLTGQPSDLRGRSGCECCVCVKERTGRIVKQSDITHDRYGDIEKYFAPRGLAKRTWRRRAEKPPTSYIHRRTATDIASQAKNYSKIN
ncbi:Clr2 domain-containing protein [Phanerochaete sordida]|uniref:Clr2 domain-containing protein n=1 Tax=Phanerochaete sordida TaxID=48140 RepID=A0A9P3GAD4_9APHY|nr:Clr2 domain-containing protein [Phanerochaete sordida]